MSPALLALLALLVTRVLSPGEAFSGFSHPATVSVATVLVLTAGLERTGVVTYLARRILAPMAGSELLFTVAVMVLIATLSAFINNTAATISTTLLRRLDRMHLEHCRSTGREPPRIAGDSNP